MYHHLAATLEDEHDSLEQPCIGVESKPLFGDPLTHHGQLHLVQTREGRSGAP